MLEVETLTSTMVDHAMEITLDSYKLNRLLCEHFLMSWSSRFSYFPNDFADWCLLLSMFSVCFAVENHFSDNNSMAL